jgi:glycosyltransferase involved in cell wall biosynthesis
MPERDFPVVQHTPILAREILATGGCLILSRELYNKMRWLGISEDEQLLTVNPKNISEFRTALETALSDDRAIERLKENARKLSEKTERFDQYIDDMVGLYEEVLISL